MTTIDLPSTLRWTPTAYPSAARPDPLEQMARDDRDDWVLLRLVVCVAIATLTMAVASTLVV